MIPFKSFRYIFPPRADKALPATSLKDYDDGTYIAQPKLNGDCMLIFTNGIETVVMNRHKESFNKQISLMPILKTLHRETTIEQTGDKKNKWMVLVGEYMVKSKKNAENKIWNDKFVIFDIIVFDDMQLIGKTFDERQDLLEKLYGKEEVALTDNGAYTDKFLYATEIQNVFRVKSFRDCFTPLWEDLIKIDMYEGLVLKKANAKLENGNSVKNNVSSQVKFRKPTKNYAY